MTFNCSSLKVTTESETWQVFHLYYNSHTSQSLYAMALNLGMNGIIMLYAHARFDDLDLDARSQLVDKGKSSALNYVEN